MAQVEKARVFMSGRSQAVRIPAEYRFTSKEVYIRRDAQSGDVILSQAPDGWNDVYAALDKAGFRRISSPTARPGPPAKADSQHRPANGRLRASALDSRTKDTGQNSGGDHGDGPGQGAALPRRCPGNGDKVGYAPQDEGPTPAFCGLAALGDHAFDQA